MNRRSFVATAILALAIPAVTEAQQAGKVPKIGVLQWGPQPDRSQPHPLREALRVLGYIEGQNVTIEWRWAGERADRAASHAAEFVRIGVDVIVASATPSAHAARDATRTIPIVMAAADPVRTGLIASLARPGGNLTGISTNLPEIAGKRLQLLREIVPGLARVAFLGSATDPAARLFVEETQTATRQIGLQIQPVIVNGPDDFEAAFAAMARERAGAVIVQPIFFAHNRRIADLAARHRLPTVSDLRPFAEAGNLMAYGSNIRDNPHRLAAYIDRILKGATPAELPVEQPTRVEFVINMRTARALGLSVPPAFLVRADHVIE